jgi:hypothetical protein
MQTARAVAATARIGQNSHFAIHNGVALIIKD